MTDRAARNCLVASTLALLLLYRGEPPKSVGGPVLRPYETMLLVDPRRTDAEIEATIERFSALVSERGGEMTNIERWGRRRLAYEIGSLAEGYYALCTYSIDAGKRADLETALPFVEGLVRSKTVRPDIRTRGV